VLEDAYTTDGDDLRLSRRSLPCRTGDRRVHTAESGKTVLLLPDSAPSVRSMLAAFASPVVTAREQSGGRMTVEGILETTLLYMTDDSAVPVTVFQEEPFRLTFNVQAGEEDFVTLHCADIDASPITSDRVELRYVMHLTADGVTAEEVTFVTDAQPVAVSAPTQDIVLYFTQPGETLWDIARRYRVPVKGVRELNPELTGDPKTGQGVVVWRREKMA
ncbi:MAG: LysM peptidoglycan-binding domain-containing protein, partial [Clostridia bacterium]|nr:LysM peptidoglycan-binding domain-containing protein [Clostridia bacterium]